MTENEMLAKAISLAAERHKDQRRRDGSPYIYHPIRVAELVKSAGFGIRYQCAALFHDLLEDTDTTEEEIRVFGEDILEAVKLLTRPEGADEAEYVAAILQNHMAAAVKAADKLNNLWDCVFCPDKPWARKYVTKSRKYYYKLFSPAVDDALDNVEEMLAVDQEWEQIIPCYTEDDMTLYMD